MTTFFHLRDDSPDEEDLEEEIRTMYPGFVCKVPDTQSTQQPPMYVVVPLFGRLRFVRDLKGVLSFGFIVFCFMYSIFTTMFVIVIPHYLDGNISGKFIVYYLWLYIMCLLSLLNVSTTNPGEVTKEDSNNYVDKASVTYCKSCHLHRPPRVFHCIYCSHCIRQMDYHYTWLNNCVGEENHHLFFLFLLYTFTLCVSTLTLGMVYLYRFPKCFSCDRDVFFIKHSIWLVYIENILCIIAGFQTLISIIVQHLNIIMNRTILENIFLSPVTDTRPRTKFQSYAELFKTYSVWRWFLPFRRKPMEILHRKFFDS